MNYLKAFLFYSSALLLAALPLTAQQMGSAKVLEVIGTASKYSADGTETLLRAGAILTEGDSVSVTALSQVDLVFSNGSELTIEENTSVNFNKLQQAAYGGSQKYEQLQADPSASQTLLELNYGQISGHVKKLRSDSSFMIETPLGTAAIRGTKFSILLIYNAERGEFILIVKNFDGLVDIISRYAGEFEYGAGDTGDKGYEHGMSDDKREAIPQGKRIVLRIGKDDPFYDELFSVIEDYLPDGPKPVLSPGKPLGIDIDDDGEDDIGIIVVSPEGPGEDEEE